VKVIKLRKANNCDKCKKAIEKGEKALSTGVGSWRYSGTKRYCVECAMEIIGNLIEVLTKGGQ